jgi:hypothetical protein
MLFFVFVKSMTIYPFSSLISKKCQFETFEKNKIKTINEAEAFCLHSSQCVAFDVDTETTFYSMVEKDCELKLDEKSIWEAPAIRTGTGFPRKTQSDTVGSIFIDTDTTNWFQVSDENIFVEKGRILKQKFESILISGKSPELFRGKKGDIFVFIYPKNPLYFHVFEFDNGWKKMFQVDGPGMNLNIPEHVSFSGFK